MHIFIQLKKSHNQCGGFGIFIPDPGSWFLPIPDPGSRIPDPKTAMKDIGEEKFVVILFFWSHKFHNIELFYFWNVEEEKKIWANFQRIIELFTQKIVSKLSKIWVWDPGSEIWDPEKPIPDPGSRGQKGTGSRIRIRNTGHNLWALSSQAWSRRFFGLQIQKQTLNQNINEVHTSICAILTLHSKLYNCCKELEVYRIS